MAPIVLYEENNDVSDFCTAFFAFTYLHEETLTRISSYRRKGDRLLAMRLEFVLQYEFYKE